MEFKGVKMSGDARVMEFRCTPGGDDTPRKEVPVCNAMLNGVPIGRYIVKCSSSGVLYSTSQLYL